MTWWRIGILAAAVAIGGGCDRVSLAPPQAASAPIAVEEAQTADLRASEGKSYAEFVAQPGMARYRLSALGLAGADIARFDAGMAVEEPAFVSSGGGARALVFAGCSISGCPHARSVLAIDLETGDAFVGVAGAGAAEALIPNDRIEALLRVTSPTMRWEDPGMAQVTALAP